MESVFKELSAIDTAPLVKKKGALGYISWSVAVRELLKKQPSASWEFTSFDGLPYLKTETGFYVECEVKVGDVSRKQMMPVLDNRNKPLSSPNAFEINKSQMRTLAKCIALHGLGLDLWAGEDIDDISPAESNPANRAIISKDQYSQLAVYCISVGEKGAEWTATGTAMMDHYKINDISNLPESLFSEAITKAKSHAEKLK